MAKACAVCGRIAVEANMGAIGAVMAYGSPAQQRLAADLVLAGDKPAICITEPEAGSAATEMTTRGGPRHGDTWVIDGVEHWITGGGVSRLHLIFARAFEEGVDLGIGGFLVVRGGEGDPAGLVIDSAAFRRWGCGACRRRRSISAGWRCRMPWCCARVAGKAAAASPAASAG